MDGKNERTETRNLRKIQNAIKLQKSHINQGQKTPLIVQELDGVYGVRKLQLKKSNRLNRTSAADTSTRRSKLGKGINSKRARIGYLLKSPGIMSK